MVVACYSGILNRQFETPLLHVLNFVRIDKCSEIHQTIELAFVDVMVMITPAFLCKPVVFQIDIFVLLASFNFAN